MSGFAEALLAALVLGLGSGVLAALVDVPGESATILALLVALVTFAAVISRRRPPRAVTMPRPPAKRRRRRR